MPTVEHEKLCDQITALLDLDAAGALVPHGVGGHARTLLTKARAILAAMGGDAELKAMVQSLVDDMNDRKQERRRRLEARAAKDEWNTGGW